MRKIFFQQQQLSSWLTLLAVASITLKLSPSLSCVYKAVDEVFGLPWCLVRYLPHLPPLWVTFQFKGVYGNSFFSIFCGICETKMNMTPKPRMCEKGRLGWGKGKRFLIFTVKAVSLRSYFYVKHAGSNPQVLLHQHGCVTKVHESAHGLSCTLVRSPPHAKVGSDLWCHLRCQRPK